MKSGFTLIEIMIVVLIIGLLAAIAVPSYINSRDSARTSTCINNLREIDSAKEQWAMFNNKNSTDEPGGTDLTHYMKSGAMPICPSGTAAYNINTIGISPTCPNVEDNPKHVLPNAVEPLVIKYGRTRVP